MTALPSNPNEAVVETVRHVRVANLALRAAVFRLDDGGYSCTALNNLSAGTSMLLAAWAGRPLPGQPEQHSPAFNAAAKEWRRYNGRSY